MYQHGAGILACLSHVGSMPRTFTLEYWEDKGGYVGRIKEVPGVFSQGKTIAELEQNIRDAYQLLLADTEEAPSPSTKQRDITVGV